MKHLEIKLLLGLSLFFLLSCSKDKDDDSFSLEGRVYAAYAYKGGGVYFGSIWISEYDVYWVYRFTSSTRVERTAREKEPTGRIISTDYYSYELNYPTITFKKSDGSTSDGTFLDKNIFRMGSMEYNWINK